MYKMSCKDDETESAAGCRAGIPAFCENLVTDHTRSSI
jgi:hypothetical protein